MQTLPPSNNLVRTWLAAVICGKEPCTLPDETILVEIAQAEGVLPLCHDQLRRSSAWMKLPATLRSELSRHAYQAVAIEILLAAELRLVLTTLAQENLSVLLLKGTALAYTLYPEPHLRDRCDIDLLFPTRDEAERAWSVLKTHGYQRSMTMAGDLISYEFSCYKTIHGVLTCAIDVHWRLSNSLLFAERFNFAELAEASVPISALGPHARGLCPVHALLLACIHRVSNLPDVTADRLIWLFDIHLLSKRMTEMQWELLIKVATERSLCGPILDGLQSAKAWFGTATPELALEILRAGATQTRWRFEWLSIGFLPSNAMRLRWLRQYLFPDISFMREQYGFHHPMWLPWFYAVRIVNILRRIGKLHH